MSRIHLEQIDSDGVFRYQSPTGSIRSRPYRSSWLRVTWDDFTRHPEPYLLRLLLEE